MMRKVIGIAVSLSVLLSLPACRTANVGMGNRNYGTTNGTQNGTTNFARTSTINNPNATGNLRDGVYIGFGNGNANGIERAIVTITNGKIDDIRLASVSPQAANNYGNRTSSNQGLTNNQSTTNTRTGANMGMNNTTGTGTTTGINTTTGTGTTTGTNNTTGTGTRTATNNTTGTGTATGTNNTTITGTGTGQAYGNDTGLAGRIDNWNLAINRALDQARR
jgi:hypothetical protein